MRRPGRPKSRPQAKYVEFRNDTTVERYQITGRRGRVVKFAWNDAQSNNACVNHLNSKQDGNHVLLSIGEFEKQCEELMAIKQWDNDLQALDLAFPSDESSQMQCMTQDNIDSFEMLQ